MSHSTANSDATNATASNATAAGNDATPSCG